MVYVKGDDMVTQKRLKELFDYDPDTGVFKRIKRVTGRKGNIGDIAGSLKTNGYINIFIDRKQYLAHRLAWLYQYGEFPAQMVDHIDGDKSNNKITNLREATRNQNNYNATLSKRNKSGCKCVYKDKVRNQWVVEIKKDNKKNHIGRFYKFEDAVKAYKKHAELLHGEFVNYG